MDPTFRKKTRIWIRPLEKKPDIDPNLKKKNRIWIRTLKAIRIRIRIPRSKHKLTTIRNMLFLLLLSLFHKWGDRL